MRPEWDDIFLEIVPIIGKRGTCNRGRSGCIIVKDNRIISTGYVGSPSGMPHCDDVGHDIIKFIDSKGNSTDHCCRSIHAEENAIIYAAKHGIKLDGSTLYCTMVPCPTCAKSIIGAGIKKVVCIFSHSLVDSSRELFSYSKIDLIIKNPKESAKYE
jgi:dCMP deaminase